MGDRKRPRIQPEKQCRCTKCGAVAQSIPGTRHRRCGGKRYQPVLQRGKWEVT